MAALFQLVARFFVTCSQDNQTALSPFCNNACSSLFDYPVAGFSPNCYFNPNVMSTVPDAIRRHGVPFEEHQVTTPDGYIITLFRIPPQENDNRKHKQPIVLQHGLIADSSCWVSTDDRSLAFNLADQGYDVWMSNARETRYSRKHTFLKVSDKNFFAYSLDDVAINDTITYLEKIAEVTGKNGSIIYVGHSRGSTTFLMAGSERPGKMQELLQGAILLSPVVFLHFNGLLRICIKIVSVLLRILHFFEYNVLLYHTDVIIQFNQLLCRIIPYICRSFLELVFGKTDQLLPDDLLISYGLFPTSIPLRHLQQYIDMYFSGRFQKFDYGEKKNLQKYDQKEPPLYNLANFATPVWLLFGQRETTFVTEENARRIYEKLGSKVKFMQAIPVGKEDQFNHVDFLLSKNMKTLFYEYLFEILDTKLAPIIRQNISKI